MARRVAQGSEAQSMTTLALTTKPCTGWRRQHEGPATQPSAGMHCFVREYSRVLAAADLLPNSYYDRPNSEPPHRLEAPADANK
jgi:hypothetical protein